jgi:hypothetical protein
VVIRKRSLSPQGQTLAPAIIDEITRSVVTMISDAENALQHAADAGDRLGEGFYAGVRVALAEFDRDFAPPEPLAVVTPLDRGRYQAWAVLGATLLSLQDGMAPPPLSLPEFSEHDRRVVEAAVANPALVRVRAWTNVQPSSDLNQGKLGGAVWGNLFVNRDGIGVGALEPEEAMLAWSEVATIEYGQDSVSEPRPELTMNCHDGERVTYRVEQLSGDALRSLIGSGVSPDDASWLTARAEWHAGERDDSPHEAGSISAQPNYLALIDSQTGRSSLLPWRQLEEVGVKAGELAVAIAVAPPRSYFIVAEPQTTEEHDRWLSLFTRHGIPQRSSRMEQVYSKPQNPTETSRLPVDLPPPALRRVNRPTRLGRFGRHTSVGASGHSLEAEAKLQNLLTLTEAILASLTNANVSDIELQKAQDDAVRASAGWTELAEQGQFVTVSKPYSEAMAHIVMGLEGSDEWQVMEGVRMVPTDAARIQHGDLSGSVAPLARSRNDWPSVEFDRDRELWVCSSHKDPKCSECPGGAFALLAARNKNRPGA